MDTLKPARNRPAAARVAKIRPDTRPGARTPKSSPAARRLIRAALRATNGNQRAAARLLRLPNQAQLRKMLAGDIRDTPAMLAALARAEARARAAWALVRPPAGRADLNAAAILSELDAIARRVAGLAHVVRGADSSEAPGQ